jgi:hypothetical protein
MTYTAAAYAQAFRQDGESEVTTGAERITNDRNAFGANFEARRPLDAETQLAIGAAYTLFRYPTNPGQDAASRHGADRGPQPAWWLGSTSRRALSIAMTTRSGRSTRSPTPPRAHVRPALHHPVGPAPSFNWKRSAGRGASTMTYARATLISTGRDDTFDLFVRCSWRFAGAWSVRPYAVSSQPLEHRALHLPQGRWRSAAALRLPLGNRHDRIRSFLLLAAALLAQRLGPNAGRAQFVSGDVRSNAARAARRRPEHRSAAGRCAGHRPTAMCSS